MKVLRNNRCSATIIRCCFFMFFTLFVFFSFIHVRYILGDASEKQNIQRTCALSNQKDPLCFIHQSTRMMWGKQDFLVIFGFPSLDIPLRGWRRRLQRVTCWQLPGAAARHNHFSGALLPLYLLARHPIHNLTFSSQLVYEAEQWQDIVIHPMNEGRPSTKKIVSDEGYWGTEAEIGSSQKTFFWFQFALRQFPRAPYVGKGDDDTFLSVPQYLADLRLLPIKRIYWGRNSKVFLAVNNKGDKGSIKYMLGFCLTLSRDAAASFAFYKQFQNITSLPYSKKMEPDYIAMNMQYEDVMVGRFLQEVKFPVIYVNEGYFRFWLGSSLPPNAKVVAIHKPNEYNYYAFTSRVINYKRAPNSTQIVKEGPNVYNVQNSE